MANSPRLHGTLPRYSPLRQAPVRTVGFNRCVATSSRRCGHAMPCISRSSSATIHAQWLAAGLAPTACGRHMARSEEERRMRLFGSTKAQRAPEGYRFGRDLAHEDHGGWRKLVLIRHGQTDYNVRHIHQGHLPGIPLNEE